MTLEYDNLLICEAIAEDAEQICAWWNDGAVMEHAGFPNGLGVTEKEIIEQINGRLHLIYYMDAPIGEMHYREADEGLCEIGIKICDLSKQNLGLGKVILSMFIDSLFNDCGFRKIVLDTDLRNKRSQHVYERLGFQKIRINQNSWKDQSGEWRSSVDYELTKDAFISFL